MGFKDWFDTEAKEQETQVVQLVFTQEHVDQLATAVSGAIQAFLVDEFAKVGSDADDRLEKLLGVLGTPAADLLTDLKSHVTTSDQGILTQIGNLPLQLLGSFNAAIKNIPGIGGLL